jgi:hypothetical protein
LLQAFALALGQEADAFAPIYAGAPNQHIKIIRYPGREATGGNQGVGAHILPKRQGEGLQQADADICDRLLPGQEPGPEPRQGGRPLVRPLEASPGREAGFARPRRPLGADIAFISSDTAFRPRRSPASRCWHGTSLPCQRRRSGRSRW